MGCGGSKEVSAPQPKEAPVQELPPPPPPPAPKEEERPVSQPEMAAEPPQDPDAADPTPLMTHAPSLKWLVQFAWHPEHGQLTPTELQQRVTAPATAKAKTRYLDVVGSEASAPAPMYWVWVEQSWTRSVRELVGIVENHIKFMEPSVDPSQLGVWLDCVCGHVYLDRERREATLEAARSWLAANNARPTLLCMDRVVVQDAGRDCGSGGAPGHGGAEGLVSDGGVLGESIGGVADGGGVAAEGTQRVAPSAEDAASAGHTSGQAAALPGSGGAGAGAAGGVSVGVSSSGGGGTEYPEVAGRTSWRTGAGAAVGVHAPVMILFRSNVGLHGFQKAMFEGMFVTHLD